MSFIRWIVCNGQPVDTLVQDEGVEDMQLFFTRDDDKHIYGQSADIGTGEFGFVRYSMKQADLFKYVKSVKMLSQMPFVNADWYEWDGSTLATITEVPNESESVVLALPKDDVRLSGACGSVVRRNGRLMTLYEFFMQLCRDFFADVLDYNTIVIRAGETGCCVIELEHSDAANEYYEKLLKDSGVV